MSHVGWNGVKDHLRAREGAPPPAPREVFWEDFRARARLVRQDGLGVPAAAHPWRWVYAGAAAVAMVAIAIIAMPWRTMPTSPSAIKSLEVVAPHSGVIIMNDDSGRGTILWITGLGDGRSG